MPSAPRRLRPSEQADANVLFRTHLDRSLNGHNKSAQGIWGSYDHARLSAWFRRDARSQNWGQHDPRNARTAVRG